MQRRSTKGQDTAGHPEQTVQVLYDPVLDGLVSVAGHLYKHGVGNRTDGAIATDVAMPTISLHADEFNELIGAEEYYSRHLFGDYTFGDLPLRWSYIIINATDMTLGSASVSPRSISTCYARIPRRFRSPGR